MKENVRVHNRNKLHRIGAMQREHPTGQHSHHSIQHFHHHDGPFLHSLQGHLHPHEGVALFVDPRKIRTFSLVNPPTQVHVDLTLLYFRISRTRLVKASSTLIRCLAEVSMNLQPKCLARSRPSKRKEPQ